MLCGCGCGEPAPIAKKSDRTRGWVSGRPLKFIQGHSLRTRHKSRPKTDPGLREKPPFERVLLRSVRLNGCLLWQGCTNSDGYGWLSVGGKTHALHRWVYEHHYGLIPEGYYVCHRCDRPNCVEPTHLWVGTQSQNIADAYAKGRRRKVRRHV